MTYISYTPTPSTEYTILKTVIEEGVRPSAEQIQQWHKTQVPITITAPVFGRTSLPPASLSGKITSVFHVTCDHQPDTLLRLGGIPFDIYRRQITSFRVTTTEEVSPPLLLDAPPPEGSFIRTITLHSQGERFLLDRRRLEATIPFFKKMLNSGCRESQLSELDASPWATPQELQTLLQFIDGKCSLDRSNAVNFLILSDFLGMVELHRATQIFFIQNLTQVDIERLTINAHPTLEHFLTTLHREMILFYQSQPNNPVNRILLTQLFMGQSSLEGMKHLTLECRKSGQPRSTLQLPGAVIHDILRVARILGAPLDFLTLTNVNDSDLPLIVESLKANPQIRHLDCSWTEGTRSREDGLTDEGAALLGEALSSLTSLKSFILQNHRITDRGLLHIVSSLSSCQSLEVLDFACNQFSSSGFETLIERAEPFPCLKILDLTGTGIGKGLKASGRFVHMLSGNMVLQELHLGMNSINDEGACGFCEIIRRNRTLKKLDLRGNAISLEGRSQIHAALDTNHTLEHVQVNVAEGEYRGPPMPYAIVLRNRQGEDDL